MPPPGIKREAEAEDEREREAEAGKDQDAEMKSGEGGDREDAASAEAEERADSEDFPLGQFEREEESEMDEEEAKSEEDAMRDETEINELLEEKARMDTEHEDLYIVSKQKETRKKQAKDNFQIGDEVKIPKAQTTCTKSTRN